jgi:hypothetical protein
MRERYGKDLWCRFGFRDAFHPEAGWYSPDVIGIDLGIMLLMAENVRSQSVWETVMATPEAQRGLAIAGLVHPAALLPEPPAAQAHPLDSVVGGSPAATHAAPQHKSARRRTRPHPKQ